MGISSDKLKNNSDKKLSPSTNDSSNKGSNKTSTKFDTNRKRKSSSCTDLYPISYEELLSTNTENSSFEKPSAISLKKPIVYSDQKHSNQSKPVRETSALITKSTSLENPESAEIFTLS